MESNKRVHLYAAIAIPFGSGAPFDAIRWFIGNTLSKQFSGCTIHESVGFWSPDGHDEKNQYQEPIQERVFVIHLSIKPELFETAVHTIRQIGSALKGIPSTSSIRHIHIERFESTAHHIEIPF